MRTFYIFGSGEYGGAKPEVEAGSFIIAADGGLDELYALGLTPDLIVGDFDSLAGALPEGVETFRHPVMKDATDMELAVREAVRRGAERVVIYGGTGGRLDHTVANIQLLVFLARRGIRGYLTGSGWTVTALNERDMVFPAGLAGTVSVFAYSGEARVTETGLLYALEGYMLTDDTPLGVSNSFTGGEARVEVSHGTAIVMWETGENGPALY